MTRLKKKFSISRSKATPAVKHDADGKSKLHPWPIPVGTPIRKLPVVAKLLSRMPSSPLHDGFHVMGMARDHVNQPMDWLMLDFVPVNSIIVVTVADDVDVGCARDHVMSLVGGGASLGKHQVTTPQHQRMMLTRQTHEGVRFMTDVVLGENAPAPCLQCVTTSEFPDVRLADPMAARVLLAYVKKRDESGNTPAVILLDETSVTDIRTDVVAGVVSTLKHLRKEVTPVILVRKAYAGILPLLENVTHAVLKFEPYQHDEGFVASVVTASSVVAGRSIKLNPQVISLHTSSSGRKAWHCEPFVSHDPMVREMCRLQALGKTQRDIAKEFGCSYSTVSRSLQEVKSLVNAQRS